MSAVVKSDFSYEQQNSSQPTRRDIWGIFEIHKGPYFVRSREGSSFQWFDMILHVEFNGLVHFISRVVLFQAIHESGGIKWLLYMHLIWFSLNISENGLPRLSRDWRRNLQWVNTVINLLCLCFSWLSFLFNSFIYMHHMVTCHFKWIFVCIFEVKIIGSSIK